MATVLLSGKEFEYILRKCRIKYLTFGKSVNRTAQTIRNWTELPTVPIVAELKLQKVIGLKRLQALKQECEHL